MFSGAGIELRVVHGRKLCGTYLVERLPLFDSSKIHSWFPVWQRLQGGPFSAPTHFIFKRRQTVQALDNY